MDERGDARIAKRAPMVLPRRGTAGRVDNLLVAGRCESMTHDGQSAARVTGGCFVMGQAAGTAAISRRAKTRRCTTLDVKELQRRLVDQGPSWGAATWSPTTEGGRS